MILSFLVFRVGGMVPVDGIDHAFLLELKGNVCAKTNVSSQETGWKVLVAKPNGGS